MLERFRPGILRIGRLVWELFGLEAEPRLTFDAHGIERPWLIKWHGVPKRSAGPGFSPLDYEQSRTRATAVAQRTLGSKNWRHLQDHGFLDIESRIYGGLTYRLRTGRRVQLLWDDPTSESRSPWPYEWLCINPTYPLPAVEFLAHLFLYVRDQEEEVICIAAPQPFDQELGRCF